MSREASWCDLAGGCPAARAQAWQPAAGAGERRPTSGRDLPVPSEPEAWWLGEMMFPRKREMPPPLVSALAGDRVPVTVARRVLKLARQPYYAGTTPRSPTSSVSRRTGSTPCTMPTSIIRGSGTGSWPTRPRRPGGAWRVAPRGRCARRPGSPRRRSFDDAARGPRQGRRSSMTTSNGYSLPTPRTGSGSPSSPTGCCGSTSPRAPTCPAGPPGDRSRRSRAEHQTPKITGLEDPSGSL